MIPNVLPISLSLLAGVGAATAAGISRRIDLNPVGNLGISNQCQQALLGLTSDSATSSCLNLPGLVGLMTLAPNSSVIPPINSWLQGMCRANACNNDTLNHISTTVAQGCQSDVQNAGGSSNEVQAALQAIPQFYPTIRKIACLKTNSNNTLCISSLLLDVQDQVGRNLSVSSAFGSMMGVNIPRNLGCTGCVQGALRIVQTDQPAIANNQSFQNAVSSQCGSNFLSSSTPSDVVDGTGNSAPTGTLPATRQNTNVNNNNGAMSFSPVFGYASMVVLTLISGSLVIA